MGLRGVAGNVRRASLGLYAPRRGLDRVEADVDGRDTQADQKIFRLLSDRVDALLDTGRWIGRRMW